MIEIKRNDQNKNASCRLVSQKILILATYYPPLHTEGDNRNYWNLMHFLLPMELGPPSFLLSSTSCLNSDTWRDSEVIKQVDDITVKRLYVICFHC